MEQSHTVFHASAPETITANISYRDDELLAMRELAYARLREAEAIVHGDDEQLRPQYLLQLDEAELSIEALNRFCIERRLIPRELDEAEQLAA